MNHVKIEPRTLLSTLWIFILFNMIFRDLHQFANASFVQELLVQNISEELVLVFGVILEIPIAMVLLSRILKNKVNKWVNLSAVLLFAAGLYSSFPSADLDDLFFMLMETIALVGIVWTAWKLPVSQTSLTSSTL